MNILFFDDDKDDADRIQSEWIKRFCESDQSCLCVVMTEVDVLLYTDLSLFQAIFLCIDIPGLNGMDLAAAVRRRYPAVLLILISRALSQAPEGCCVNAFRFLRKENMKDEFAACADEIIRKILEKQGLLSIKERNGWRTVKLADILYIEGSANRKVYFHMASSEIVEARGKLADHTENLREQGFLRIQRGYLVNLRHVVGIKNYLVGLDNGEALKASVQNYSEICRQYARWRKEREE